MALNGGEYPQSGENPAPGRQKHFTQVRTETQSKEWPIHDRDIADDAHVNEFKLEWDETTGHDHSGYQNNGQRVDLSENRPIGTVTPNVAFITELTVWDWTKLHGDFVNIDATNLNVDNQNAIFNNSNLFQVDATNIDIDSVNLFDVDANDIDLTALDNINIISPTLVIDAPTSITITTPQTNHNGDVVIDGSLTVTGDMNAVDPVVYTVDNFTFGDQVNVRTPLEDNVFMYASVTMDGDLFKATFNNLDWEIFNTAALTAPKIEFNGTDEIELNTPNLDINSTCNVDIEALSFPAYPYDPYGEPCGRITLRASRLIEIIAPDVEITGDRYTSNLSDEFELNVPTVDVNSSTMDFDTIDYSMVATNSAEFKSDDVDIEGYSTLDLLTAILTANATTQMEFTTPVFDVNASATIDLNSENLIVIDGPTTDMNSTLLDIDTTNMDVDVVNNVTFDQVNFFVTSSGETEINSQTLDMNITNQTDLDSPIFNVVAPTEIDFTTNLFDLNANTTDIDGQNFYVDATATGSITAGNLTLQGISQIVQNTPLWDVNVSNLATLDATNEFEINTALLDINAPTADFSGDIVVAGLVDGIDVANHNHEGGATQGVKIRHGQVGAELALSGLTTDDHHPQLHTLVSHTDVNVTGVNDLDLLLWDSGTSKWINSDASVVDKYVRISGIDVVSDYLSQKLVSGVGITLTTLNPGGNEQLEIKSSAPGGTVPIAFGETYLHTATGTVTLTNQDQYYPLTNLGWIAGNLSGFVHNAGVLTSHVTGSFHLTGNVSYTVGSNQDIELAVFVSGVHQNQIETYRTTNSTGNYGVVAFNGILTGIVYGDTVEVRAKNVTSPGDIFYAKKGNLCLHALRADDNDELVKVSAADTVSGYLFQQLAGVTNKVELSILNPGADEDVQINVREDIAQWNADELQGRDIATTAPNNGQVLAWDNTASNWYPANVVNLDTFEDIRVKVSANETAAGYLVEQIQGTTNKITVTEINDGADEYLQINAGIDLFDKVTDNLDDVLDGTVYGKVKQTELVSGQVQRVLAVVAATVISGDDIYNHFVDYTNPHQVTSLQVGKDIAQWNADEIQGTTVDHSAIADKAGLFYDSGSGNIIYRNPIILQDEGTPVANTPHHTVNVTGPNVQVTDSGGGVAQISIDENFPTKNAPFLLLFGNQAASIQGDPLNVIHGIDSTVAGYVMIRNTKITGISWAAGGPATVAGSFEVRVNGVAAVSISMAVGDRSGFNGSYNYDLNAGDEISVFVNGFKGNDIALSVEVVYR